MPVSTDEALIVAILAMFVCAKKELPITPTPLE
jgi:hypothetical protein